MKKIFLFLMAVMVAFAASAGLKVGKVVDKDGRANLRQLATTNSAIVGSVKNGKKVKYEAEGNGWYAIYDYTTENFLGYMHSSRIKAVKESVESRFYATLSDPDGYVNVRESPSTNSRVVARYKSGNTYQFSGKGKWLKIYNNGRFIGYVHSSRIFRY